MPWTFGTLATRDAPGAERGVHGVELAPLRTQAHANGTRLTPSSDAKDPDQAEQETETVQPIRRSSALSDRATR
jgi:hypothetical protein